MNRTASLVVFGALLQSSLAFGSPGIQYVGVDLYSIATSDLNFLTKYSGGQVVGTVNGYATLWDLPNGSPANLNPANYLGSSAAATDGVSQVGYAHTPSNTIHAALWKGTADSFTDLHPTHLVNIIGSQVRSVTGGQQVGVGYDNFISHAMLWNGTAESAVDLSPTGFGVVYGSEARGTDGTQQVGYADVPNGIRAIVWEGSGSSAIDLHPGHFTNETGHEIYAMSLAHGVAAGQQVGAGLRSGAGAPHAMLWQGTAESAVNLHPSHLADVLGSSALATNGSVQVGWGSKELTGLQAFLWRGTPDSAVDLHALLPEGLVSSVASSIDGEGRIYGVASGPAGYHAVMWTPIFVPEPSALASVMYGVCICAAARRRWTGASLA